ncbi:glycosyltransferase [Actinomadura miaoliensis]|uniref:Glycosyltransferase n=1 Tax=Actinomadura miaoliensis TaxID=430685 RepID=A0ABP7WKV4_9ACTN
MSPTVDRHVVTAVLVAHDGARWLPETLKALLTQTRPVQRLVAVDTGSRDRGPAVLAEVAGTGNVLTLPRATGYGQAIAEALRHPAASLPVPDDRPGEPRTEWVWLLHDDSAPAPDALALLLRVADADPRAAVLGVKARDWYDRRTLLELGVSMDGAGRRETGLDRHELDQGQRDGVRDVLAVGSAGMLVRRDVWDRLGGFDADFGLFRDDIDFCWRAHAAGHRVLVVSDAVVHHAQASHRGLREIGMFAESRRRRDRRNALYTLLANVPVGAASRILLRNLLVALTRALYLTILKRPQDARDELAALADVLRAPGRLRRARKARAEGRRHVYRSVRRLMPRRVAPRRLYENVLNRLSARDDEDETPAPEGPGRLRRVLTRPGVMLVLALTAVTLAAERSLLTAGGRLGGGALVPASGGAGDLWAQYVSGWHPVGLGSDAGSPPYVAVLAALSTVLFGKPWLAMALLLLASVPLAGLTAYYASRTLMVQLPRIGRRARGRRVPGAAVRVWFAASYALLPSATGAVSSGRFGTSVVIVLLPLIAVQAVRLYGLPRRSTDARRADRAAWAVAFLLTIAMAFVPLTWLLALAAGALSWVLLGGPRVRTRLVIALGVPPLLLLPWTVGLLLHPSRFLLEAGLHGATPPLPTAHDLLTLNPGGPGVPARWTMYGLVLAALCALLLRGRRTVVAAGWAVGILGLLTAILISAATVTKGADSAPAWPGVALTFAAAGILLAAAVAVRRAAEVLGRHLVATAAGGLIGVAAVATPLLAAGAWVLNGAEGPVGHVPHTVPLFVNAPTGPRTLVLHREDDGRVSYTVLRGTEPSLGENETPGPDHLQDLVAAMAAGRVGDGPRLTRMGIQYVLVPRPARDALTPVLDANPELTRLNRTGAYGVWRLQPSAGRLMLLDGRNITPLPSDHTNARVRIPPGNGPRTLLLAEPADGGWRATLDGRDLKGKTVDGWAQAYDIPASGGMFDLSRSMILRHTWVALQAVAVLVVAALALPGTPEAPTPGYRRRPRRRVPADLAAASDKTPADAPAEDSRAATPDGESTPQQEPYPLTPKGPSSHETPPYGLPTPTSTPRHPAEATSPNPTATASPAHRGETTTPDGHLTRDGEPRTDTAAAPVVPPSHAQSAPASPPATKPRAEVNAGRSGVFSRAAKAASFAERFPRRKGLALPADPVQHNANPTTKPTLDDTQEDPAAGRGEQSSDAVGDASRPAAEPFRDGAASKPFVEPSSHGEAAGPGAEAGSPRRAGSRRGGGLAGDGAEFSSAGEAGALGGERGAESRDAGVAEERR